MSNLNNYRFKILENIDDDDLLNILAKVKEIGFDGVEFAGYQSLSAEVLHSPVSPYSPVCR
mgnify:CR=1 FL=1